MPCSYRLLKTEHIHHRIRKETAPCCLGQFLALHSRARRYHLLKPEYIHHRIKELGRAFRLRIILCHVDAEDAVEPLAQVGWWGWRGRRGLARPCRVRRSWDAAHACLERPALLRLDPAAAAPSLLPQVTRAALGNDCTLICGWSNQECGRYLETFKRWGGVWLRWAFVWVLFGVVFVVSVIWLRQQPAHSAGGP